MTLPPIYRYWWKYMMYMMEILICINLMCLWNTEENRSIIGENNILVGNSSITNRNMTPCARSWFSGFQGQQIRSYCLSGNKHHSDIALCSSLMSPLTEGRPVWPLLIPENNLIFAGLPDINHKLENNFNINLACRHLKDFFGISSVIGTFTKNTGLVWLKCYQVISCRIGGSAAFGWGPCGLD